MSRGPTLLQLQTHADNVSHVEQVWWRWATITWQAGDFAMSDNFTVIGGEAEHFLADLDPDPAFVTSEEDEEAQRRLTALDNLVREAGSRGYGASTPVPTLRPIQIR